MISLFLPFTNSLWLLMILVVIFELATLLLRFKFKLKGKDFRLHVGKVPMHHSIWGLLLIVISIFIFRSEFLLTVGWAFIISDLIHHLFLKIYVE